MNYGDGQLRETYLMLNTNDPEVLIAGAGPVGLYAGLALTQRGIRVAIADKDWRAGTHSYALALHPQSLGLFHQVGLLDQVMAMAHPVRSIGLYNRDTLKATIQLEEFPGSWSHLAVLRQDALEDLLEQTLAKRDVKVMWSHEVFALEPREGCVDARVDKFEKDSGGYSVSRTEWVLARTLRYSVPFVIGADGYRSRVRRASAIEFPEVAPAQHYAVFEFQTDIDLGSELRLVFGENTTDVLWPLPGGYCRWSFEMPEYHRQAERQKDRLFGGASLNEYPELTTDNLKAFIAERAPWFQGAIGDITWRNVVRFEKHLANSFGTGRMWLAGDAAHLAGPAGVQSMNLGLAEVRDLTDIISCKLRGEKSLDSFQGYGRRWSTQWRLLHGLSGGLKAGPGTDPWVASISGRLLSCLPAHGEELGKMAEQVGLSLKASAGA
jgi:2-polyprenyl-6-methoxyphenol hydroxylase-like FAD-dependent oxidoreductase